MRILGYLPLDAVFKSVLGALEARGHEVRRTFNFGEFRRALPDTDIVLMNFNKNDTPRYVPKVAVSALTSALARRPLVLFFSVDPLDLCDRPIQRVYMRGVNQWVTSWAARVVTLPSRAHILDRYGVAPSRRLFLDNLPNLAIWRRDSPEPAPYSPSSPEEQTAAERVGALIADIQKHQTPDTRAIHFLYHGELLWWHGLELFAPVMDAVQRRGWQARLIVAGHFYDSSFRALGMRATRPEAEIKQRMRAFLQRPDVTWLERIPQPLVRGLMEVCDFHVTQLRGGHIQAETELRTCLLEAMAAGMVCLHRPTRALRPDVFRDGENIIHLPRDPSAAAEALIALRQNDERRRAIGHAAAQTILDHFNLDRWIDAFEPVMQRIVSASDKPR